MTERGEPLIRELLADFAPVRRLPALSRVFAWVCLAALGVGLACIVTAGSLQTPWPKPDFGAADVLAVVTHLLLAGGALGFALAASVPGRDAEARLAGRVFAAALALLAVLFVALALLSPEPLRVTAAWCSGVASCTVQMVVIALLPGILVARFCGRAAPHEPARALYLGAVAALALSTLPGFLGCLIAEPFHVLVGHVLAPLVGGAVLLVVLAPIYRLARR